MTINYRQARYLLSAPTLAAMPPDVGAEVAFIGRSNAGKSSALNTITGINGLARTSKTPGRTQMVNFFALDDTHRLVDLPGYGFAKVPPAVQAQWMENIEDYLNTRKSLRGLVIVMDIRHPFSELDLDMFGWALESNVPVHALLTKADKLTPNAQRKAFSDATLRLQTVAASASATMFSSLKRVGVPEMHVLLNQWLQ